MELKDLNQIFAGVDENSKEIIDGIADPELKVRINVYLRKVYGDFINSRGEVKKLEPLNIKSLLEHYENLLISEGKVENTTYSYILRAKSFLNYIYDKKLNLINLDMEAIESYLANMRKGNLKINSFSKEVVVLKSFINFLNSRNYIFLDTSKIKAPKKVATVREVLSSSEVGIIEAYLSSREEKFKCENLRDSIIFYLGVYCGLRRQEIINLNWDNIDIINRRVKIIASKGGKDRAVFINSKVSEVLINYKKKLDIYKGAVVRGKCRRRITKASLQKLMTRIFKESKVYRQGLCIHSLRHTFAENLRKKGTDIYTISMLLGHSQINTTETYLHVNEDDLREAIAV